MDHTAISIFMLNLPVWKVNGETFTNKLHAKLASKRLDKDIHFDLYDSKFLDFDWAYDDPESFESILARRCKQLRDTHRYIRLFYSGGHDSHTMLLSFLQSNTHVDEIVINIYSYWQTSKREHVDDYTRDHPLNREQFRAAIPFIKKISSTIPKTKITIETLTGDYLNSSEDFTSTIQQNSMDITVDKILHRKMLFGEDKTHGAVNLLGAEKPRLKRVDGRYYWYCLDNNITGTGTHDTQSEMFYITPGMPELHRKQCHMMLRWVKQNYPTADNIDFLNSIKDDNERQSLNESFRWPLWHNESNLGLGKKVLSEGELYATQAADEKTLQLLKIDNIKTIMDRALVNNSDFADQHSPYNYAPCFSYQYYIGR
tara:strand:+ start:39 stop:1151 length:1113 start_codon:yes stop_codon:yes gene_type:complete